jgi:solute carrier family 35 protein F1/2
VRYLLSHIIGVAICIVGVACLIYADVLTENTDPTAGGRLLMCVRGSVRPGSNRLLGDILVLAGATLYAVSNVCTEFFVKSFSRVEFLGMIGLFGSIISGLQL